MNGASLRTAGFWLVGISLSTLAPLACDSTPPSEDDRALGGGGGDTTGTGGTTGAGANDGSGGEPSVAGPPALLSETGLYADDMETLREGVFAFTPRFPLYSDGAEKSRWVWLPEGTTIDTSDPDYWIFPIGAKLWKEFVRDGVRIETRLTEKRPDGTWWRVAYHWRGDQTDADAVPDGLANASGTDHDIPSTTDCTTCHGATRGGVLGFSAIQLAHEESETTLDDADAAGWLSTDVVVPDIPGDATEVAALGYLHANCGTCHNPTGGLTRVDMDVRLRLGTLVGDVSGTPAYQTAVDQPIDVADGAPAGATLRVTSGQPNSSAIYLRMHSRGELYSMPQLGTELIDDAGSQVIFDWITALP